MGRDVIIGVLYLPDTIWEYFTQEKEMEGYAAMQNQLAAVMRQMVLDRKDFDKLMVDMKKIGLHDSDALPFLNCMCSNCGGSLGGNFNPSFQTDIGHGPCQCNGPLTIWKTPLPVKDKERQYECFNEVTRMRYNQAQGIFNQWHQKMKDENFKSVEEERKTIDENMAKGNYMEAADSYNAIEPLVEDYMVTKYYDGKAQGENYSYKKPHEIMEGLRLQAKSHAEDISKSAELRESVKNMSKACSLKINPQWCEKEVEKYKSWEKGWYDTTTKEIPDAVNLIKEGKINSASTALQAIHDKINKQQLPPRHNDPLLTSLNEQLREKRNVYSAAMERHRDQLASFNKEPDPRSIVKTIEKIKEAWEHSQMTLETLGRQHSEAAQNVRVAEANDKAGDKYKEQKKYPLAVDRYQVSLKLQKDTTVQRKLNELIERIEAAKKILSNGQKQWKEGKIDQAINTTQNAIETDPSNQSIAKVLKGMQKQKEMLDDKIQQAADLISQVNLKEAERKLASAAIINDKYQRYLEMAKKLAEASKNAEKNKRHQEQAAKLIADGYELEKNGKLKAALDKFQQAQKLDPSSKLESHITEIEQQLASRGTTTSSPASIIKPPLKPKTINIGNVGGVDNGPQKPTTYQYNASVKLLFLGTYHWNHGKGKSPPGKIGLRHNDGTMYGPWQTSGRAGQGGVPNAYWEVNPNVQLKPGTYTVVDSDPKTWATNAQEGWKGFATIRTGPLDYPNENSVRITETSTAPTTTPATTASGSFAGTMNGTWQGTGNYKDDYSGSFTMQINNNGSVVIKYGGDDEGTFTGNILNSGELDIKQATGTSGSFSWKGTIKKDSKGNLSGKGTWSDEGVNGTWQSKGALSTTTVVPPVSSKETGSTIGKGQANISIDLDPVGKWRHGSGISWTITRSSDGRYNAQEKGLGNASGPGYFTPKGTFRIDYVTRDGIIKGYYEVRFSADGKTATGTVRELNGPKRTGLTNWKRIKVTDNDGSKSKSITYLGCYKDQGDPIGTSGRDISGYVFNDSNMTTDRCISECRSRGFSYAGTQYGKWCFCGNSYGKSGSASNCNMHCSGNSSETCGGSWANSVYQLKGIGADQ